MDNQRAALALLPPDQMATVVNTLNAMDEAKFRNRIHSMQIDELSKQQQFKSLMQNLFPQQPQMPAAPPQQPPAMAPAQTPQPPLQPTPPAGPAGAAGAAPMMPPAPTAPQGPPPEAMAAFQGYKRMWDMAVDTGNSEWGQRILKAAKSDQRLSGMLPPELDLAITDKGEYEITGTLTPEQADRVSQTVQNPVVQEQIRALAGSPTKQKYKDGQLVEINPATTEKSKSDEQLIRESLRDELGREPTAKEILERKQTYALQVAEKRSALGAGGDPKQQAIEIGDAIMRGEQPPVLSGFGMAKIAAPLKAYLARKGYNLRQAELDYKAMTRHMSTLNGPQQLRLRQATQFAYDSLNLVEELANKWKAGRYPLLNKARLAVAKQGVYGKDAQQIATQLETQISDLTSELGTVYKGGNSSTDESLRLASKNLSADWSLDQLLGNVGLVRKNLDIRLNSLKATGAAGISEEGARFNVPPAAEAEKWESTKTIGGKQYGKKGGKWYLIGE